MPETRSNTLAAAQHPPTTHTEGAHSTAGSDMSSRPTHGTTHESNAGLGLPPPHDSTDDWSGETTDELRAQVATLKDTIDTLTLQLSEAESSIMTLATSNHVHEEEKMTLEGTIENMKIAAMESNDE